MNYTKKKKEKRKLISALLFLSLPIFQFQHSATFKVFPLNPKQVKKKADKYHIFFIVSWNCFSFICSRQKNFGHFLHFLEFFTNFPLLEDPKCSSALGCTLLPHIVCGNNRDDYGHCLRNIFIQNEHSLEQIRMN